MILVLDDKDRRGAGCGCDLCNANGHSYGVGIYPAPPDGVELDDYLAEVDVIERVYGPSEEAGWRTPAAGQHS